MKAKLKIDYFPYKAGSEFIVYDIHHRFITLIVDGKKADFGFGEFQIVDSPNRSYFGRLLAFRYAKGLVLIRNNDFDVCVSRIKKSGFPITSALAHKALGCYAFGNCR